MRRGAEPGDHGRFRRQRDRLHRHRGRLSARRRPRHGRPDRGDRRGLAAGPASVVHRGHQVLRPDGAQALGPGYEPQAHRRGYRGIAAAPWARTTSISTNCTASIASTPLDEALEALDSLVRAGKTRYVGVSNWMAHRLSRALGRGEVKNLVRIDSVQPRYNLLFRAFERDLLPLCQEEGVAVIPYNLLAGGLLTGKHGHRATARLRAHVSRSGEWAALCTRRATGTSGSSRRSRACASWPAKRG